MTLYYYYFLTRMLRRVITEIRYTLYGFFNGTVDTCCKAITLYISILETARELERERERERRNDSSDGGLGLDPPSYNIFVVHCTRQPKWHSAHNAHTQVRTHTV